MTIFEDNITKKAKWNVRMALVFAGTAVLIQYILFFARSLILHSVTDALEVHSGIAFLAILFIIVFTVIFTILWFWGLPIVLLFSELFYQVSGKGVELKDWHQATKEGLWAFPYTFGMGAILYIAYFIFNFGARPYDLLFQISATILASLCCFALLDAWSELKKPEDKTIE